MRLTKISWIVLVAFWITGCKTEGSGSADGSALPSDAASFDAALVAGPDALAPLDSAGAIDLSVEVDAAVPDLGIDNGMDAAIADDLAITIADDLTSLDDLTALPDLTELPDLTVQDLRPVLDGGPCGANGNIVVFANFEGGVLNINVDVDLPDLKIGVVSYEPVTINIGGTYAANVTEVRYAGFVATTNAACANSPTTTTITGVSSSITSVNLLPPVTLNNPNGYSSVVCGYTCSTTTNQGGCNTADQIRDYFATTMGGTIRSYFTQYGCYGVSAYSVGQSCNCSL